MNEIQKDEIKKRNKEKVVIYLFTKIKETENKKYK